ncbi:MAG: DEAD/DEAH box helicase, partial [Verrucomicrobiales bacterium]
MSPSSKQPSPTPPGELLEHVADSAAFTPLLDALGAARAGSPLRFEHVAPAAQAFVAALAIRQLREAGDLPGRVWILCGDLKAQERVAGEIDFWLGGGALFFPESETLQFEEAIPDPEITAERMSILHRLATRPRERAADAETPPEVLVLNAASLAEEVPSPASMQQRERRLVRGERLAPEEFKEALESAGYLRVAVVDSRGQFARRGGILDIYSWQAPHPVRIELFDEEIESLREFDIHSQISIGKIQETAILLEADKQFVPLADYITGEHRGESDLVLALDCQDERSRVLVTSAASGAEGEEEDFESACFESPLGGFEAGDLVVQGAKREAFQAQLAEWKTQSWMVAMAFNGQGEIDRFSELIDSPRPGGGFLRILSGRLNQGFAIPGARLAVISDAEVFGRYHHNRARRLFQRDRQQRLAGARSDFKDFTPGDLVVHSEYGIGRFLGIGSQDPEDPAPSRDGECVPTENVLLIEYAQQARLYVPLAQAHLVSRYVGVGRKAPSLSRLGGNRWTLTRVKAQRAVEDYAAQLLSIHAERDAQRGFEHPPDTRWQWEFEHSFPYKETPDQLSAIEETKADMESARNMDRLICGDVGFGKTEVAIRAAFKSVMSGRQVAILVPTTVLAQQHFQTFRERMSEYPVNIELLSRFRTKAEQGKVVRELAAGSVDIVIGTHRLISSDISFKNLGLVVIDEEQRFGVKHKERFKVLFRLVDVLTLSATPIPRTLYLALMGARDMSSIETPPPNRFPVHTSIC